jgi:hypothetical protein
MMMNGKEMTSVIVGAGYENGGVAVPGRPLMAGTEARPTKKPITHPYRMPC